MRHVSKFPFGLFFLIALVLCTNQVFAKEHKITGQCGPGFTNAVTDRTDPGNADKALGLAEKIRKECLDETEFDCLSFGGTFKSSQQIFLGKAVKGWHNFPKIQRPGGPEQVKKAYDVYNWVCTFPD